MVISTNLYDFGALCEFAPLQYYIMSEEKRTIKAFILSGEYPTFGKLSLPYRINPALKGVLGDCFFRVTRIMIEWKKADNFYHGHLKLNSGHNASKVN